MPNYNKFSELSPTDYADGLERSNFIDYDIKPLWGPIPRIAGPAYTVEVPPGDSLMMHAAIYDAPVGSIIVVNTNGSDVAVAGGNVCGIAQKRGIAGFVIDGVIRDIAEIREMQFPVFARGIIPIPSAKKAVGPINPVITCGGASVSTNDIIIADEEGIAVVPNEKAEEVFKIAQHRFDTDAKTTLDEWEVSHHRKIDALMNQ